MSRRELRFVALIPAIASVPLFIGIMKLSIGVPGANGRGSLSARKLLQMVCVAEIAFRVGGASLGFILPGRDFPAYVIGRVGLYVIGPLTLFGYLGNLLGRFGSRKAGKLLIIIGGVWAALQLLFDFDEDISRLIGTGPWNNNDMIIEFLLRVATEAVVGGFGLVMVWWFSKAFPNLTRGKCWGCGYDLTGRLGMRCPECGGDLTAFEASEAEHLMANACRS